MPKLDVIAIHTEAHHAGMAAVERTMVEPMHVVDGSTVYKVEGGVCGFAWVSFKGNTRFGKAMKAAGLAAPGTYGGLEVWVRGFGQSMTRKEAYARGYAAKLRELGYDAQSQSRMD